MNYKQIKYEVSDRILTITLYRPDRLNAYTEHMREEIIDALDHAEADDDIRVIIVTGEGSGFCAGMDLGDGSETFDYSNVPREEHRDGGGLLTLRIFKLKKPIIAAINGPAVGVGITMTLPMDIRIASTSAKMGFVFARRGIVNDGCSSWFLPRVVGIAQAMEWFVTGRVFTAQEALEGGLVKKVVAPEELLPTARAIALEITNNTAPVSVALARQLLLQMLGADHPIEAHKVESMLLHWIGQQPDKAEGINSFLEKRLPNFTMSAHKDLPEFYPWWTERPFKDKNY